MGSERGVAGLASTGATRVGSAGPRLGLKSRTHFVAVDLAVIAYKSFVIM